MTEIEKYVYEIRKKEFFDMIYHSKPIATLVRRDYKDSILIIYKNAFYLNSHMSIGKELCTISLKDMDYMAHLYASYEFIKLKEVIEDFLKNSSYLTEQFSVNIEQEKNFYYGENTIFYKFE